MAYGKYGTEEALLTDLRKGSQKAYEELYVAHYGMVVHFIAQNSGSEEEAKDIYQESIAVLHEKLSDQSFKLNASLKTYLYAVARRKWLHQLRQQKRRPRNLEDFEQVPQPLREELSKDKQEGMFETMEEALEEMGQPCKTILELFYFKQSNMEEISEQLGYTNARNAKNQKYKCLKRLKSIFHAFWSKKEDDYDG